MRDAQGDSVRSSKARRSWLGSSRMPAPGAFLTWRRRSPGRRSNNQPTSRYAQSISAFRAKRTRRCGTQRYRMRRWFSSRDKNPIRRREQSATFATEMPSRLLNSTHCYWHWRFVESQDSGGLNLANSSLQPIGRRSARGLQVNRLFPASFAKRSMRMFQAKHIAGVLIAICLASTGETAPRLEPPDAAKKVTVQPRGRAYLFRGFIGLTDWGMDELTDRINRAGVTADVSSYLMWRGLPIKLSAITAVTLSRLPLSATPWAAMRP